ncbi:MAG: tRNA pseudouridine(38-40) synthase TruA [Acidobacteria bacterium]|nr:tRNA pseudouridine(38-40) synthase TruA [Acidobacteriota bacterium]
MRNLKLTLAYDGADFHGWQVQPGRATIQGALAEALEHVTGATGLPQGAGRTDAGVHALGQVAAWSTAAPIPARNLAAALNDALPPSIRVLAVEEVAPGFHPRGTARAKTYRYRIFRASVCPPFIARYVWHHPYALDEAAMMAAAPLVEGRHDFTSFAAVDAERSERLAHEEASNVRTIFSSRWARQEDELIYTVRGDGFLHHMVRNLVGAFLLVGRGTLQPQALCQILAARSRSKNPAATAPAAGLCLMEVEY